MSEKLKPLSFQQLLSWMLNEYKYSHSIFNIPVAKWHKYKQHFGLNLFDSNLEAPVGPAAGPHTQMAQNIISAYLTGARFFELKTIQIIDDLKIDKPCIDAADEGYNTEWSQELKLHQSFEEYIKAWVLIHFLNENFQFSESRDIIFNMSIGYDLKGIQSKQINKFIDGLHDVSGNESFNSYIEILKRSEIPDKNFFDRIPLKISGSATLSTMHGCPPEEIEEIVKYLIAEKGLHTYVKLNPTLLGCERVKEILNITGYNSIDINRKTFENDLQMNDAVHMLRSLKQFADDHHKNFGIKVSNTLPVNNIKKILPGNVIYMSGRTLFPLTINLAAKLVSELKGKIHISFSGGVSLHNACRILSTGIYPVTYVTELLKPGGYFRQKQIAESIENVKIPENINAAELNKLARESLNDEYYRKDLSKPASIKINKALPKFDCSISPCTEMCPIHQDVSEYIHLVSEMRYADALEVIYSHNPLPNITGYICDHLCESKCTRWDYDSPVNIRELKKLAAEFGYQDYLKKYCFPTAKKYINIAVIGAGPAGLASAYFLSKAGFNVTVFDKENSAGGTVKNIIPEFRLPRSAIDNDINFIRQHGVLFCFNSEYAFSIEKLKSQEFKYIIIAIGAGKSKTPLVGGNNPNRFQAIEFLKAYHQNQLPDLGKHVVVIGGGNSAMDSARAALRCPEVQNVYIVYRRTKEYMPADPEEFEAALSDGVIFHELLTPVKYSGTWLKCVKMKLCERDTDGRRKAEVIENEYEYINTDAVIFATGEEVDSELLNSNNLSLKGSTELDDNIYIIGDALRGPATVVKAIADARSAAESIMKKENIPLDIFNTVPSKDTNFQFNKGVILSKQDDLLKEAARCLHCNIECSKCVEVCPNRSNILIHSGESFRDKYQVLHIDDICNECGNCETFCPYEGKPYRDKYQISLSENTFETLFNNPI